MSPVATRRLLAFHRVCGLIISINLFVLASTGLILVFHEEIDRALGVEPPTDDGPDVTDLATATRLAQASRPNAAVVFLFQEPDDHPGIVFVGLAEGSHALADAKPVAVDRRSGAVLAKLDLDATFTGKVLKLHSELFLGPLGRLLVGLIAVCLLVTLGTGAVLYGPIMRRFAFGLLRRTGARRTVLADLHKLLGISTIGWTVVVAATGLMLSLGSVLLQLYAATELAALGAPYAQEAPVLDFSNVDAAVRAAESGASGRHWALVAFPGSDLASPRHYTVLLQGTNGLEAKVLTLALVDAKDPAIILRRELPGYLKALLLSEPLHFGNYGGLAFKIVWAAFAVALMILSGSGVAVFVSSRRTRGEVAA